MLKFKSIYIKNFKCIEELLVPLNGNIVRIVGANGAGKTSILDAIAWLLYSKNSEDKQKFSVLPVDKLDADPYVILDVEIDGEEHELTKRIVKGMTQTAIDDIPRKVTEYETWIRDNISSFERFKMYTNPTYFPELNWKDQRALFMSCFETPQNDIVINIMNKDNLNVSEAFKKDIAKYKPEDLIVKYACAIKEIEKQKDETKGKLDATIANIEELSGRDPKKLKAERDALQKEISAAEELEKQYEAKMKAYNDARRIVSEFETKVMYAEKSDERKQSEEINKFQTEITGKTVLLNCKRREFEELAKKEPADICPVCKQAIPANQYNAAMGNYKAKVEALTAEGQALKTEIDKLEKKLKKLHEQSPYSKETVGLNEQLSTAQEKFDAMQKPEPIEGIFEKRNRLTELDKILAKSDVLQSQKEKKTQYEQLLKTLAGQLADSEVLKKTAEDFITYRAKVVVQQINKQLQNGVQIELFDYLKGGGTKDTFVITKDGVPYADLNSTGKVEAGLTLTGFIKKAMGIQTPVIIDNFERYPNLVLPETGDQYILALADKNTKKIEIK